MRILPSSKNCVAEKDRKSSQEGRIIKKEMTHFITYVAVIGGTNISIFALANVTGSSQAKYSWGYGMDRSDKLITFVKSLINRSDKFSCHSLALRLAMLTIILVMKHIGKDGNPLISGDCTTRDTCGIF